MWYDEGVSARDDLVNERFERAKLPLLGAAFGIALGLAVAGSVERTAGGAIVLASWVLGVAALHRLGRAGSVHDAGDGARATDAPDAADERAKR